MDVFFILFIIALLTEENRALKVGDYIVGIRPDRGNGGKIGVIAVFFTVDTDIAAEHYITDKAELEAGIWIFLGHRFI